MSTQPEYNENVESAQQDLAELRAEIARNPKPSNGIEGFRRWKIGNLLGRWAEAQADGRHELAVTQVTKEGAYAWVCTCGLLVPATHREFNAAVFFAAEGHRAMPRKTDWNPNSDNDVDEAWGTDEPDVDATTERSNNTAPQQQNETGEQ